MIIIKKVAFGNNKEAFIEDRFKDGLNIIFSNDNNKGKTLVMQSLMYSIGNQGIFPSGFNLNDFYFYTKLLIQDIEYSFLRKGNSIIINFNNNIYEFTNISDFKYYFSENIYKLPSIIKDGVEMIVDPTMFYELFFLGQDERKPSNLIIRGFHNKEDFLNMLYSLKKCNTNLGLLDNKSKLKSDKKIIELKISNEKKKITILKDNPLIASYVTQTGDNDEFSYISKTLKDINKKITDLRKKRFKEENRKINLENLITELRSLNMQINEGNIICGDCGGANIIYTNSEFKFDVTNDYVKKNILNSIYENISIKESLIKKYSDDIFLEQNKIKNLLNDDISPDIKNYILFDKEIKNIKDIDLEVIKLNLNLNEIKDKIKDIDDMNSNNKEEQKKLLKSIINGMKEYYDKIDPGGQLEIDSLFAKNGVTYSGSEGQEYYFCKIMSLNNILLHNFPIVIDSFREGEISTTKEKAMIDEFIKIGKQIILTSTLKDEEFNSDKYYKNEGINPIDYSNISDSKILNEDYVDDFRVILNNFNVKI